MNKYRRGLIIGRFQPFHLGHLQDVKLASRECEEVIIAIGSSQEGHTIENPLAAEERIEMIDQVLFSEGIPNYSIFLVPDIFDDKRWVEHVKTLVPDFQVVYTENSLTEKMFAEKHVNVHRVKNYKGIHSTKIRQMIKEDNPIWKEWVPKKTIEFMEKVKGIERIKSL